MPVCCLILWDFLSRILRRYNFRSNTHTISSHLNPLTLTVIWATTPFYLFLFSAVVRESPNSTPAHFLMLSSHFFCLPLLFAPFIITCRIVFTMPEDLEMSHHLSYHVFTMVRSSSCTPIAFGILLRISSFVTAPSPMNPSADIQHNYSFKTHIEY